VIQVIVVDQAGKRLALPDIATAAELNAVVEQARALIRECEREARLKAGPVRQGGGGGVPYLA